MVGDAIRLASLLVYTSGFHTISSKKLRGISHYAGEVREMNFWLTSKYPVQSDIWICVDGDNRVCSLLSHSKVLLTGMDL